MAGEAGAVVTTPINKKALYDGAGFAFPGHTEFLADLAGVRLPVMMLAAPGLRVVPVTIHIPLAEAPRRLTTPLIVETGRILAAALTADFGIEAPRTVTVHREEVAAEILESNREAAGVQAIDSASLPKPGS